ncbi:MAG TPA: 2,3-dihydroxybenzoate-AMP ligase [Pseudomonas sp.]|jgi:2,3-dihydroxybenzoate-AMP ligase|uniref:(2,3-dihydroxybenzoyl)adenylate synthase n=1 Tax=Stutzerimonas xanthomarina TaxID=271420 RepID=UPI000E9AEBE5|nr:(2,3-dihydroxybenzoyl)adenylate synthase [Stutzerimonas xanthomarina]MBU0851459.1 (2,3-dihydroxybenzoyl)adenylate synthase [Gammaproteobacteria bacterium]HAQ87683.1 2,3-dihydroxybenzoate-AMP ligase [Pseudomonas sp.]MBK3848891.1 (2,3-dihydroxybenzoyl)adenylate synthase [Stutzerimonas xanthomarina]MBU1301227.1 (2,3-dihydroxybenzoyl)adenylate synthase [Gammaproteobacteria bacterium]MBU1460887.1 (2,3-dihydroxybenzoyl)adenylate synthase [Gammaproteobacteria bacterium]|tara:strand:+ start:517 stop:2142 length:1626 start_codon:yes stop_codon:yes gene_type:complete
MSLVPFTRWPEEFAERYRLSGYWRGEPLSQMLVEQASTHPDTVAVIDGSSSLSYADLDRASTNLAQRLANRGLGQGDCALVQLGNQAELYVVFFALIKAGIAPVNALFSHNRLELVAYAEQIRPRLLIASRAHSLFAGDTFVEELTELIPGLDTVLLHDDPHPELCLQSWFEPAKELRSFRPTPAGEVAFFQLSGGSTGTPKLIPRTHDDYLYSVRRSIEICQFDRDTRYLCALPAAHNFPLSSPGALGVFLAGGRVVLSPDPGPASCFPLIAQQQVNVTALVPSALAMWLQAARGRHGELDSLQLIQVGGAKLPEAQARRVPQVLGCRLQQVFGMAEGLVNYTRLDDSDEHIYLTQGHPMSPADEVRVVDREGHPVAGGDVGALMTRGPYTIRGYFQSPEHNAVAFDAEGFYRSGDLVRQQDDGYIVVVGRIKDQINRGGEKIAAEEVENLLMAHPAVTQAALVSVPDEAMGEKSCAYIVTHDATLKGVVLRKFLRGLGLAEYKLPDRFEHIDTLPMTAVGKVDKNRLRRRVAEQLTVTE